MCGVIGVYSNENAAEILHRGLYSLQHRGEESAGLALADDKSMSLVKGSGLVEELFENREAREIKGTSGVGHVRYSLIGESNTANAPPFAMNKGQDADSTSNKDEVGYDDFFSQTYEKKPIAVVHNGNFNSGLEDLCGDSDTKVFSRMLSKSKGSIKDAVMNLLGEVEGSYALVISTPDMIIGARDSMGYRPLSLGSVDDSWILSSETCAFNEVGAKFVRDINPGEVLFIDKKGLHSEYTYTGTPPDKKECVFEHIYLARSDSVVFGKSVYKFRKEIGHKLAEEGPAKADIVVAVPDAGRLYAQGYAEISGIHYEPDGFKRNHYYPGRTFIKPEQEARVEGANLKFFAVPDAVKSRNIVLIDDSIVRGVNIKESVRKLRTAGAKQIHVRVASPPYVKSCDWGVDTYDTSRLIALNETRQQMLADLDIDSLNYLSLDGLLSPFDNPEDKCVHCFSGA